MSQSLIVFTSLQDLRVRCGLNEDEKGHLDRNFIFWLKELNDFEMIEDLAYELHLFCFSAHFESSVEATLQFCTQKEKGFLQ